VYRSRIHELLPKPSPPLAGKCDLRPRCAHAKKRAFYAGPRPGIDGKRDVLGLWVAETEAAKIWLEDSHRLKSRGISDGGDSAIPAGARVRPTEPARQRVASDKASKRPAS
jgi:hypothetical protein